MASPRSTRRPAHRTHAPRRWVLAPLRILVALAIALATLPFVAAGTAQAAVTSIAIDGDQDGLTTDWQGLVGTADVIQDGIIPNDASGIRDQEDSQPWTSEKSTASGKSDIGYVRVAASYRNGADHLIGVIGFDRGSGSGTGRYYFELNQVSHDLINPTRTAGDVRIIISVNGNRPEDCTAAQLSDRDGLGAGEGVRGHRRLRREPLADQGLLRLPLRRRQRQHPDQPVHGAVRRSDPARRHDVPGHRIPHVLDADPGGQRERGERSAEGHVARAGPHPVRLRLPGDRQDGGRPDRRSRRGRDVPGHPRPRHRHRLDGRDDRFGRHRDDHRREARRLLRQGAAHPRAVPCCPPVLPRPRA